MDRKLSVLFLVLVIGFPVYIRAQSASGIIAPSRMVNWSIAGVQGGIPNRTSVCATLKPGATVSDINSAIASCPQGQVVYLNAGTYNLSGGISFRGHNNVTIRGAGPDKTFLNFSGTTGCGSFGRAAICVGGSGDISQSNTNPVANWTGGYAQGSTQVTLSNTSGLSVGSLIVFDQLNDSADTGNIYVTVSGQGSAGVDRSNRAQNQVSMVTAINGNTVTISPGIYMPNWRASQSPQAYWPKSQATGVGVEDMSIDTTNASEDAAVAFDAAVNSWETNVRSVISASTIHGRDHVWLWYSAHISVISNYFYGTKGGDWSQYGVEADGDSMCLVENNIFQHIVTPLTIGQASGDVYSYNYSIDDWVNPSNGQTWMQSELFPHGEGTSMDLFEGNQGPGIQSDDVHGSHVMNTLFRNRLLGWDEVWGTPTSGYQNTIPVNIEAYGRYYNVIGNVLGEANYHTIYDFSGTNSAKSIYVIGYTGEAGKGSNDSLVGSTLMRWGNYDTATNAIHWDASEVPSDISLYGNSVPSTHSLPASFYLSSKPSWWGTPWGNPPWPAIGPDVTGGSGPGGHSYDIPAKLCYDNTSKDNNGILNFNANSCYSSSPAPAAPTNLGAVAH
jgi:hypothetical protein